MTRKRKAPPSVCGSQAPCDSSSYSMEIDQPFVKLESCDGKRFMLSRNEAASSNVLRVMLEQSPDSLADCIPFANIDGHLLGLVVDWCVKHPIDLDSPQNSVDHTTRILRGDSGRDYLQLQQEEAESWQEPQVQQESVVGTGANQRPFAGLTEWQREFFKLISEDKLFALLHVANFLDVQSLFDAACETIAKVWESKKVEEIRKQYRIHCDYSQEEEQQMRLLSKRLGLDD